MKRVMAVLVAVVGLASAWRVPRWQPFSHRSGGLTWAHKLSTGGLVSRFMVEQLRELRKLGKYLVNRGAVKVWSCEYKPAGTPKPGVRWDLRVLD